MCVPTGRLRLAVLALCAVAIAGCATLTVRSYSERGAEFTRYKTYAWAPAEQLSTGDPRLDNNPFFHDRIRADVEKRLTAKGFEKATTGTPDVLVHYHANISQRIDVNGADREYGYCTEDECRPYVSEAGTLTIDLTDVRSKKLVWRGWAEGTLDGVIDNQKWLEEKVDDAVTKIVDGIPRR